VSDVIKGMLKEVVVANLKMLCCYLPGMTKEKTKELIWERVLG
jgi:hypothetical protein